MAIVIEEPPEGELVLHAPGAGPQGPASPGFGAVLTRRALPGASSSTGSVDVSMWADSRHIGAGCLRMPGEVDGTQEWVGSSDHRPRCGLTGALSCTAA